MRATRELSQANSGTATSMATKVALNSHCKFSTPPWMPMDSRIGRSMK